MEDEAEDRIYKCEISPHPYSTDFDTFVTDNDKEALEAIKELAEFVWNGIEENEEKIIQVKLNKVEPNHGRNNPHQPFSRPMGH